MEYPKYGQPNVAKALYEEEQRYERDYKPHGVTWEKFQQILDKEEMEEIQRREDADEEMTRRKIERENW